MRWTAGIAAEMLLNDVETPGRHTLQRSIFGSQRHNDKLSPGPAQTSSRQWKRMKSMIPRILFGDPPHRKIFGRSVRGCLDADHTDQKLLSTCSHFTSNDDFIQSGKLMMYLYLTAFVDANTFHYHMIASSKLSVPPKKIFVHNMNLADRNRYCPFH